MRLEMGLIYTVMIQFYEKRVNYLRVTSGEYPSGPEDHIGWYHLYFIKKTFGKKSHNTKMGWWSIFRLSLISYWIWNISFSHWLKLHIWSMFRSSWETRVLYSIISSWSTVGVKLKLRGCKPLLGTFPHSRR